MSPQHRGFRLHLEKDGYVACKSIASVMKRIPTGKHSIGEAEAFLDAMFYRPRKQKEKVIVVKEIGDAPFQVGDTLDPSRWNCRRSCLYLATLPCIALAVAPSKQCFSGWSVEVNTERGVRVFDADFFRPSFPSLQKR